MYIYIIYLVVQLFIFTIFFVHSNITTLAAEVLLQLTSSLSTLFILLAAMYDISSLYKSGGTTAESYVVGSIVRPFPDGNIHAPYVRI